MKALLLPLLAGMLLLVIYAYLWPFSRLVARRWVWLYTRRLSHEAQKERADDAEGFYDSWETELQKQNYKPSEIGVRILGNVAAGAASDALWRWEVGGGPRYAAWAGAVAVEIWRRKSQRAIDRLLVIASGTFTILFFVTTTHDFFGGMWSQPILLLLLMFVVMAYAMLVSVGKVIQSLLEFRNLIRESQDRD